MSWSVCIEFVLACRGVRVFACTVLTRAMLRRLEKRARSRGSLYYPPVEKHVISRPSLGSVLLPGMQDGSFSRAPGERASRARRDRAAELGFFVGPVTSAEFAVG